VKTKREALILAGQLREFLVTEGPDAAYELLEPVLEERTRFPLLEVVGRESTHAVDLALTEAFLDQVASHRTEGGWVVIGAALQRRLEMALTWALEQARRYITGGAVWYAADILGERVPGEGLVSRFDDTLELLAAWTADDSPWVRRACGAAVHHWAKRAHGVPALEAQAYRLLRLLEPMFEERDTAALKGVGWGLKTLGRFYPDLLVNWLEEQVKVRGRRARGLLLRKSLTYLPPEVKERFGRFR